MSAQIHPIKWACKCGWEGDLGDMPFVEGHARCPSCHEYEHIRRTGVETLVTCRPDSEIAKDLKTELETKLNELCLLIDKANHAGFEVALGITKRWDGKNVIQQLIVAKHF